ncbi:MAG: hypothetical protein LW875_06775 [Proteobacteria bacterium]|jgi:hypothetical protein|nr:hypothetical protein [Pseudomonadota bacterium]
MLLKISFIVFLIACSVSQAEEKPAEAAAPTTTVKPWIEVESRVTELSSKIRTKEDGLKALILSKQSMPDGSAALNSLVDEIIKEHKALNELKDEYNKALNQLRYRFPERAAKDQTFQKLDSKTLEETEATVGIDGKLNRNMKKARQQFGRTTDHRGQVVELVTTTTIPEKSVDESGSILIKK